MEGSSDFYFETANQIISPAICFESFQPSRLCKVVDRKSTLYICSLSKHQKGINKANHFFANFSKSAHCITVMSNSVGQNSEFLSAGNSAIWNSDGELVAQLNNNEEGLVMFTLETEQAESIHF